MNSNKLRMLGILLLFLCASMVPFHLDKDSDKIKMSNDLYWLAMNIYHEAGNQSMQGKLAVGVVTLNRMNHETLFASTIEDVVKERKQFSWYNNVREVKTPAASRAWNESLYAAKTLLTTDENSDIVSLLSGVTHYHATYIKPRWSKSLEKVTKIGDHIFYRIKRKDERKRTNRPKNSDV